MTIAVDTRKCQPNMPKDLADLLFTVNFKPTIRSLTFASLPDLHAFQKVLTRYTVRYDAPASWFAITRRRMVVNIHKKLETNRVRLQVLTQGNITQIAAFFEDFSYADAIVFRVKSSDVFEKCKGDKGAKFCIKLVDAKFSLPGRMKHHGGDEDEGMDHNGLPKVVKRRFINLEGLEYAEEHEDITIGFETEEGKSSVVCAAKRRLLTSTTDRERFCAELPAAATTKKFELRRKI